MKSTSQKFVKLFSIFQDTVRRYETKTTTARQLILKPPTEDELNKNFEKLRFVANETKEKPSSAGSPKTAISQENEKENP